MVFEGGLLIILQIPSASVRKTAIFGFPHMRRTAWWNHIKMKQAEKWLYKGFRYACQRPVIAPEIVCFIGFLTISAISSRDCCKIWRTTMQRKADGHAIHKQTLMTFLNRKSLYWTKKSSRVWTELQHGIGFNNTELFFVIWGYFKNVISVNLLILANDPGKCPTAKISSANFLLIALG